MKITMIEMDRVGRRKLNHMAEMIGNTLRRLRSQNKADETRRPRKAHVEIYIEAGGQNKMPWAKLKAVTK